jgi:GAF domain-containing protein
MAESLSLAHLGQTRRMPMRVTTVRFSEDHWKQLERESTREGVSAAQFIRECTIMRTAYLMGQRGDTAFEDAVGAARPGAEARATGTHRRQALLDAAAAVKDSDRVEALHATGLLDSDVSPSFDRLARLASKVLNAPVALVSLVDADRQFFKSCLGMPEPWATQRGTPLSHSFCQHAVASREPLIVEDSREHELLRDNPAIRDIGVIAYAGIPLIDADGHALGTLCVIDHRPRHWTTDQVQLLSDLAASVVTEIAFAKAATQAGTPGG